MAEEKGAGGWPKLKNPRFYTSILNDPVHDSKLQIPDTFVAEHGSRLSKKKKVVLKLPSGAEWLVKVAISKGGKMWFDEGWREFAEFYTIAPDHLLAFEYHGHGNFHVFIFTEIVYRTHLQEPDVHVKLEYGADSYAESLPFSPKTRDKTPLESLQPPPSKLRRTTLNTDRRLGEYLGDEGLNRDLGGASQKRKLIRFAGEKETSCLARATAAFKSENPFIMKVMQPSYLTNGSKPLFLRSSFFLENFKHKSGDIFLHVLGGKTWEVQYNVYVKKKAAVFKAKTWGAFARDNGLKIGDVCAFEVLKKGETEKPTLNVAIFRADQGIDRDVHPPDESKLKSALLLSDREGSEGRSSRGFQNAPNEVKLTIGNRSLAVTCGDEDRSGNSRKQSNLVLQSCGGLEAANAFTSDLPFFKVVMSRAHLSKSFVMIPAEFHKHVNEAKAELWFKGLRWGVKIANYTGGRNARKIISTGWKSFVNANTLKNGDVCIFESLKGEADDGGSRRMTDMVNLLVHVFRV